MKKSILFMSFLVSVSMSAIQNQAQYLNLELYNTPSYEVNSTSCDGILIEFTEDGYNGYDHRDALKMNNLDENLASVVGANLISIENRAFPENNETIPLFMNQFVHTDYTLWFDVPEIANFEFKILDAYTQDEQILETGENTLQFFVDPNTNSSFDPLRFTIEITSVEVFSTENFDLMNSVHLYPNPLVSGPLYIDFPEVDVRTIGVSIYNSQGKKLQSFNQNNSGNRLEINNFPTANGVYLVALDFDGQKRITKRVIR